LELIELSSPIEKIEISLAYKPNVRASRVIEVLGAYDQTALDGFHTDSRGK
jgi:hypothetical protein